MKKAVFLDTGVLKNILHKKNESLSERFRDDLFAKLKSDLYFSSTPKMLFEALGLKVELQQSLIDEKIKPVIVLQDKTANEKLTDIMVLLTNEVQKNSNFYISSMRERFRNELSYRSGFGKEMFNTLFKHNLIPELEIVFQQSLALELLQQINYTNLVSDIEWLKSLHLQFMRVLRDAYFSNLNMSFSRGISQIIEFLNPDWKNDFDDNSQFVDGDIVHSLLLGTFDGSTRRKTIVFSTENIENWKIRIQKYASCINFLNESPIPEDDRKFEYLFGEIYQVDQQTGKIKDDNFLKVETLLS